MRGLEEGVNFNLFCLLAPFLPIFFTSFGSRRHNSKVNCVPRRDDIMREVNFCGKRNSSQELSCRKKVLKIFKRVGEHTCKVESELYLDATSAILFSLPGIEQTRSGAEPQSCCRSTSARSKCPTIFDHTMNFLDQWTADVLSHRIPACTLCMKGRTHSRTSQAHRTPAISKSLIVTMFSSKAFFRSSG